MRELFAVIPPIFVSPSDRLEYTMTDDEHDAYRIWKLVTVRIAGRAYAMATKPGTVAYGRVDPAAVVLGERLDVANGDVVVHLHCGNGLVGAVASAQGAARVFLADRNVLNVEAARRTLVENAVENGEALPGHGALALPSGTQADVVTIRIPLERQSLQQLLWDAFHVLKVGGRCYIAGATNEGIRTAERTMGRLFGGARLLGQDSGHRVVMATRRTPEPADRAAIDGAYLDADAFKEQVATMRGRPFTLYSRPGVFSWDHLDEATAVLAETMLVHPGDWVLDLGCGSAALGTLAGTLSGTPVTMVDVDVEAVRSATRTAAAAGLAGARIFASDVAGEVLGAQWSEVDQETKVWTVPGSRMKAGREHRVPLSANVLAILDEMTKLRPEGDNGAALVFPGAKAGRPLSQMSMLMLLRRMGREDITAHGFRSTFRDWCAEFTNYPHEMAEIALAHTVGDKVEAAYRRGDMIDKRREMMNEWARFCDVPKRQ